MPAIESVRASLNQIAGDVTDYYEGTYGQHGATPRGVDWSCKPTQELRFIQLSRICPFKTLPNISSTTAFSLNDVGCGYGALRGFLHQRYRQARIDYLGVELSPGMLNAARMRWGHLPNTVFGIANNSLRSADYSIASGLFNVRLHHADIDWEPWVAHTLRALRGASRIGFSVNFMSPPQPGESSPQALYRPNVDRWTTFCENELQSSVHAITGYGMREYTLLVRGS